MVIQVRETDHGRVTACRQIARRRIRGEDHGCRGSAGVKRSARARSGQPNRGVDETPGQGSRTQVGQGVALGTRTEWSASQPAEDDGGYWRDAQSIGGRQQSADKIAASGRAPAGAKVIAGHSEKIGWTRAIGVVADRDIVEGGGVLGPVAKRIDGWVEKA